MSKEQKTLDELAEEIAEEPTELAEVETAIQLSPEIAEKLVANGNLAVLDSEQRMKYYLYMCEKGGLDPAGRPYEYIEFSSHGTKVLQLYAKKGCAEQLRKIHGISIVELKTERINGNYVVSCIVKDRTGRTEVDVGVCPAQDSNSLMKAVTKAKRRATLGICGLGDIEESHPTEWTQEEADQDCKSSILLEDEGSAKKTLVDVVMSKVEQDNIPTQILMSLCDQAKRLANTESIDEAARWLQENGTISITTKDDVVTKAVIKEVNNEHRQG